MLKVIKNEYAKWELLARVLSGELPEDDPVFKAWLEEDEDNIVLFQSLKAENDADLLSFDRDKVYKRITDVIFKDESFRKKRIYPVWLKYVSILLFAVFTSSVFYFWKISPEDNSRLTEDQPVSQEIKPGKKKAQLFFPDGSSLQLNEQFAIRKKDGLSIDNDTSGRLTYQKPKHLSSGAELYTIATPVGGEYELKLSDGTRVYLNAASEIIFPSFFDEDIRKIKLRGEAYFDVAKDKKPFIVETENLDILVLGTTFNLSAYPEEEGVVTTLVSGKVEMKTKFDGSSYEMSPGYNLVFDKTLKSVKKYKVDTDIYTAWVRGEFIFNNQPLSDIMRILSRWYDCSIDYEDPSIRNLRFTGSVEKNRPLKYLLNQIEFVTNIKFREDGNKIIVHR